MTEDFPGQIFRVMPVIQPPAAETENRLDKWDEIVSFHIPLLSILLNM